MDSLVCTSACTWQTVSLAVFGLMYASSLVRKAYESIRDLTRDIETLRNRTVKHTLVDRRNHEDELQTTLLTRGLWMLSLFVSIPLGTFSMAVLAVHVPNLF